MGGVQLIIPGKPFAKQRPRMTKRGHTYTPKPTVEFESVVREIAALKFSEPFTGPVRVHITAMFEMPKS